MNISASRREDLPAFNPKKCFQAMIAGKTIWTNPYSHGKYWLEIPEGSTFTWWSKDYGPWIYLASEHPEVLQKYQHRFQFTINSYRALEPGVKPEIPQLCAQARFLSKIGEVVWRYDPICHWKKRNAEDPGCSYSKEGFERIAKLLDGFTKTCTISFMDLYPKVVKRMLQHEYEVYQPDLSERMRIVNEMLRIIVPHTSMQLRACCEAELDIIPTGSCVAGEERDKNQRGGCTCAISKDIGEYNKCKHGCLYCYARD
jgi:hypothetical protein